MPDELSHDPDAVLFASYGTTRAGQREASIDPVARSVGEAFPGAALAQAYTSAKVRRALARRGEPVPGVADALRELARDGARSILVQPGHVVAGMAFDLVAEGVRTVRRERPDVGIALGAPLLATTRDVCELGSALAVLLPREEGGAYVLMGHGTDGTAGLPYAALGYRLRELGRPDLVVGAMDGYPSFDAVSLLLTRYALAAPPFARERRVTLAPLMLTAGAHAGRDMAGEDRLSWKSRLEATGYRVGARLEGLGSIPAVQRMYREHAREAWTERDR